MLGTVWRTATVHFEVISVVNKGWPPRDMMEGHWTAEKPDQQGVRCRPVRRTAYLAIY